MWRNGLFIIYCSLISLRICRVEAWSGHVCTKYWVTYFTERYCAGYDWWAGFSSTYDCKGWETRQSSKISSTQYCCDGWKHSGNKICNMPTAITGVPANASIIEAMTYADTKDKVSAEISIVKRQVNICGGYLTAQTTTTTLTSPNYPSEYENNLRCNWTIAASVNYVIVIRIAYLDLEQHTDCSFDYLSINLGRNPNLETNRICTNKTKDLKFITRSNEGSVTFVTDGSVTRRGFSVEYQAVLNCGKHLTAQTSTAILTSPLYPSQYENNLNCHWTIKGPVNSTIVMQITYIDLEENTYCTYDYLQMYLGENYIFATDWICRNNTKDINYISRSNEADVIFVTDSSVVKMGFSLQYYVATNCGGRLAAGSTSAILSSPYYPLQYNNNLRCHWTIEGLINSRIVIQILFIDLEENSYCTFDYLQLYLGESNIFETGRICRYNAKDLNLITRSNKADVILVTDGSIEKTGFSLNYTSVPRCGGYLIAETATSNLTSPRYPSQYENNLYCLWTIKGPVGSRIALNITYIDIQGNDDDCPYDFLHIYLGNQYILKTKRICGNSTKGLTFISGSNEADVIFVTDGSVMQTGFSLQYHTVSSCGEHLSAGTATATLFSPNYPLQYDNYLRCHWSIKVSIGYRININITDIDLEVNSNCSYDYLQIYLGNNYILDTDRICRRNNESLYFISMSDEVHILFITDGSITKKGFSLQYQAADFQVTISADKSLPKDGETVNLICSIPSFIVPASWIVNNTGVSLSDCPPKGPCSSPNGTARYAYSATATSIVVTITSFDSTQDTFGWKCLYGNSKAVFVIKPAIPVTTVQLTNTSGEALTSTINVVRGGITYIRCSTAPRGSRPRATFRWYNRSGNQSPIQIGNQSISSTPDPIMVPGQTASDLVISYSTLTLTGFTLYQNMHIFCESRDETNSVNYTQSEEVQLNIVYPPVVQLSPNYSLYNVTEGKQNFVFTCTIIEANPLPQTNSYSWLHKSIVLQGQTSSSYTLPSVKKSDDGEFKCTAMNDYGRGISNSMALNVQFPPFILVQTSPYKVIENQTFNITCQVNSNPPPDQISWAPSGEGSVPSRLYFSSVSRNNRGTYSCTARNTMTPTVGGQQTGTNTSQIEVDILYPPSIQGLTSPYKVIEYHPLNVTCEVNSNPLPDHISWFPIGESSVSSRLYIRSVSRNNSGTYTCSAQNTMIPTAGGQLTGVHSRQIQVDVLYNATITEFIVRDNISEIMENSTLELYCRVDSNPYSEISLSLGDVFKSRTRDSRELIHIASVGCLDAGTYICSATNSVMNGVTVSAEVNLKVHCHPRSDYRKNISAEYYVALNDYVTLVVSVIAYPEPTDIMWYHKAEETGLWQQVLNKPFSSTGLHSNISVHLGSQRYFGHYLVNMSNSLGIYERIFHVIPEEVIQGPPAFQVGPVAGGVGSGAIVAVICIILVIIFMRRRNLRNTKKSTPLKVNGSTNETSHSLEYEELHVNMTEVRPYLELKDISRSSIYSVRKTDSDVYDELHVYANAGMTIDTTMSQEKIAEGGNVIYDNIRLPR